MTNTANFERAMEIIEDEDLWWDRWEESRQAILDGDKKAARHELVDELGLSPEDAEHLIEWADASIRGGRVELVEIPVSEIRWYREEEFVDEEEIDPFEMPRYYARRGVYIDTFETEGSEEDCQKKGVRLVRFKQRTIKASQLDQAWKIVRM